MQKANTTEDLVSARERPPCLRPENIIQNLRDRFLHIHLLRRQEPRRQSQARYCEVGFWIEAELLSPQSISLTSKEAHHKGDSSE